jgi:tricorn protease
MGSGSRISQSLRNFRKAVFLYSLEQQKSFPVTDGMSDVRMPVFDVNGKYLYFTTSWRKCSAN